MAMAPWLLSSCNASNELGYVQAQGFGDMSHIEVPQDRFDWRQREGCGPGGPTAVGEKGFSRWPYIQKTTDSSFELMWTSKIEGDYEIELLTPEKDEVARVAGTPDPEVPARSARQYKIELTDLEPGEVFCYRVLVDGEAWMRPTGVRTAPDQNAPVSQSEKVRFVALGDLGKRTSDQFAVREAMAAVDFDFGILTGDIGYDNGELHEYERNVFGVYRNLFARSPFFVASGNHDMYTEDGGPFREVFSMFENGGPEGHELWYSTDWGPLHLVFADTERLSDTQERWLDEDLSSTDRPWTIVIAHRPPFASGPRGVDAKVRDYLVPIMTRHQVPLVLLGHEHHYERTKELDGVTYIVTGGGGRGTRPVGRSEFTAFSERVAHFTFLEADAETLRVVAIDATGEPFDSLLLEKNIPPE